ncbi:MAG: thiol reductant ABC exporter subunit CydD [Gracilibacteraceae bacterium]|jgi:ATP-binding cassette subfamily C protein CydD|nr:thiol reductant ABC exporter subunit CydD [Gracilibacteraceae bacterium]
MIDKNLWREAGRDKLYLAGIVLCGLLSGVAVLAQAWVLACVVRAVFLDGAAPLGTRSFFAALLALVTLRALTGWLEEWFALRLARGVQFRLREAVLAHMEKIGPLRLREEQTGELLHLVTEGLEVLHAYFGKYLPQLFKTGILPILFLGVIFPRDWTTGLILLVTAPLLPMFMMMIGKWAGSETKKRWRVLARMTGYLQDVLQGMTTLKILGQSAKQAEKVEEISEDFRRVSLGVLRIAFLSALTLELFSTLSIAIVAVALGLRLVGGGIDFQTAFFLLLLAPEFYLPIRSLGAQYHASLNGAAAAERVYAFLRTPAGGSTDDKGSAAPDPGRLKPRLGVDAAAGISVSFCDVTLTYGEERERALEGLSFELRAGEKIGLVGPSGGGKSSVLNLLLGFVLPDSGRILINGADMRDLDIEAWRRLVAWVPQKPWVFAGSIRDNLLLGNTEATEELMRQTCSELGLAEFVADLPDGYATRVGQGGRGLSGGQIQLLAIGRAALRRAPLLLLDEATANLDLAREETVQNALWRLMRDKTVVAAAHRLQTTMRMDRILVLQRGRVSESGAPAELMRRDGAFRALRQAGLGGAGL